MSYHGSPLISIEGQIQRAKHRAENEARIKRLKSNQHFYLHHPEQAAASREFNRTHGLGGPDGKPRSRGNPKAAIGMRSPARKNLKITLPNMHFLDKKDDLK